MGWNLFKKPTHILGIPVSKSKEEKERAHAERVAKAEVRERIRIGPAPTIATMAADLDRARHKQEEWLRKRRGTLATQTILGEPITKQAKLGS